MKIIKNNYSVEKEVINQLTSKGFQLSGSLMKNNFNSSGDLDYHIKGYKEIINILIEMQIAIKEMEK